MHVFALAQRTEILIAGQYCLFGHLCCCLIWLHCVAIAVLLSLSSSSLLLLSKQFAKMISKRQKSSLNAVGVICSVRCWSNMFSTLLE